MKKTVWTFGLVSGALASALMAATIPFQDEAGFNHSLLVGYATIVLSFVLIYFGVRSYRDTVGGGTIGFRRALTVGASIGLIASLCYVASWQVMYFNFMPDFLTKYGAHEMAKARAAGATEAALAQQKAEMDEFERQYQNPAINAAYTIMEPLPVALIMALVSAGVLSRKKRPDPQFDAALRT